MEPRPPELLNPERGTFEPRTSEPIELDTDCLTAYPRRELVVIIED